MKGKISLLQTPYNMYQSCWFIDPYTKEIYSTWTNDPEGTIDFQISHENTHKDWPLLLYRIKRLRYEL